MGAAEGTGSVTPSATRRMLKGEVDVGGRVWTVREEKRQGPRPQIFVLTTADTPVAEMHIRPMPDHEVTTLEEVQLLGADPDSRMFADTQGLRWEARIVLSSGELGDCRVIKLMSFQANAAYEEPYPFSDGLGLRTEEELQALLAAVRS